jgi:hypothetical protein
MARVKGGGAVHATPQKITFAVGALNLAAAALHILPLSPAQHWAQLVTGVAGLLLASSRDRARLFALLLVICYGAMLAWDLATAAGLGAWLPARMIVSGVVIEVAAWRAAPET